MLPIPNFFDAEAVGTVYRVPYQQRAVEAEAWAKKHNIASASTDKTRVCLLLIDVQNTFCIPDFELFVGGKSGMDAVEDNKRLCKFVYRHLPFITEIIATMDTHTAMQIFHPIFWIDSEGKHPAPASTISLEEVESKRWQVNPDVAYSIAQGDYEKLNRYALHYAKQIIQDSKYPLTVWPYHAILGGISHALVSAIEEAVFFHNIAKKSQTQLEQKGSNPLTENYSALSPEVLKDEAGNAIATKNTALIQKLLSFDAVIVAGQAKSHCVAWTIEDLLSEIKAKDPSLAQKIYLLDDCTSPIVISETVDFTSQADEAFQKFADAGMNIVRSTDDLNSYINFDF